MIVFVGGMMQEVPVRYDPFNVEVVYVHIRKVMELCTFFSLGGNWKDIVNYDMDYNIDHDLT